MIRRSISTSIWSDPWFESLEPESKLIFLYLITNGKTNMLGIYEASIKKISNETDISREKVSNILAKFEQDKKIKYQGNYIIIVNCLKHQKMNTNMKKSAMKTFQNLPADMKPKGLILSNNYNKIVKSSDDIESDYEKLYDLLSNTTEILTLSKDSLKLSEKKLTLSKHKVMLSKEEVEVEVEEEIEEKVEIEEETQEEVEKEKRNPTTVEGGSSSLLSDLNLYRPDNLQLDLVDFITSKNENYKFTSREKKYVYELFEKIEHGLKMQNVEICSEQVQATLSTLYESAGFYKKHFFGIRSLASNFDAIVGNGMKPNQKSEKFKPSENKDAYINMLANIN